MGERVMATCKEHKRLNRIWCNIKQRCNNPNNPKYSNSLYLDGVFFEENSNE